MFNEGRRDKRRTTKIKTKFLANPQSFLLIKLNSEKK